MTEIDVLMAILNRLDMIYALLLVVTSVVAVIFVLYILYKFIRSCF